MIDALGHWPELVIASTVSVVYCRCGEEFRTFWAADAQALWAAHLQEVITGDRVQMESGGRGN